MLRPLSRRRLVAALALLAVSLAVTVGATLHDSRAESDGVCVACIFALGTVGVEVAVFTASIHLVPLGMVEARAFAPRGEVDRHSSDSRGPPLV